MGPDTTQRMINLLARVAEIVEAFGVPEPQAWAMLGADAAQQAANMAARIDKRQRKAQQAAIRAKSAELNTLKANTDDE